MSPVTTTFDQSDDGGMNHRWWMTTTSNTSAAYTAIPVIRSRWVPEGQMFLVNDNGRQIIFGNIQSNKPLTRWERIVRWMRRFLTEHY